MLVLTRKRGERVLLGSTIAVSVLDIQGNRVKLGFECPEYVPVLREELCAEKTVPCCEMATCNGESEYHAEFA